MIGFNYSLTFFSSWKLVHNEIVTEYPSKEQIETTIANLENKHKLKIDDFGVKGFSKKK